MNDFMKDWEDTPYPQMIRNLPEIDIPIEGIRGWLIQSKDKQIVFFDIEPIGNMPEHSHCAQWGIMLDGKMKLTIDNDTRIYQKGDWYYIPAGVLHSAEFLTKVYVIDVFDDPNRYQIK
ncbi:MAG: cupin domain-containing protein [Candidatus Cloacimonetes bacterium]|nr:cupin domain-containing protein [Candidatus Cloacimonadota bacterium]MBL7086933.1 cupin domain-containing protein [Candidatus Cloacimonadota bacterium]